VQHDASLVGQAPPLPTSKPSGRKAARRELRSHGSRAQRLCGAARPPPLCPNVFVLFFRRLCAAPLVCAALVPLCALLSATLLLPGRVLTAKLPNKLCPMPSPAIDKRPEACNRQAPFFVCRAWELPFLARGPTGMPWLVHGEVHGAARTATQPPRLQPASLAPARCHVPPLGFQARNDYRMCRKGCQTEAAPTQASAGQNEIEARGRAAQRVSEQGCKAGVQSGAGHVSRAPRCKRGSGGGPFKRPLQ
jgi:hypothetical protein